MNRKTEQIIEATVRLCLGGGLRKITMDEIAESANVSKVTIYKYFREKDALLNEAGRRIYRDFGERLTQAAAAPEALGARLYRFLDILCEFTDSGKYELTRELSQISAAMREEYGLYCAAYEKALSALIAEGLEAGLFREGLSPDILFHYIDMGVSHYEHDLRYRGKLFADDGFHEKFMAFYVGNIFSEQAHILQTGGFVDKGPTALQRYIALAKKGTRDSIGEVMAHLNKDMTIAQSKLLDFALGHVESEEGVAVMEDYLFHGTQIQRNYCTLYFGRRGEYLLIRKAYDAGLIDAKQAFSR